MTQADRIEIDYDEAAKRASLYAETINVDPPSKLVDGDGAVSRELGAFCREYGASLDWIFLGDVRGMIHDSYNLAQEAGQ